MFFRTTRETEDVHDFEFNPDFEVISPPYPLREMPEEVVLDLSTDQSYAYRITKMITTGVIDWDLVKLMIGKVSHCRWLTTGSRFERLWVSKHGLIGDPLKTLRGIVTFLATDYFPLWFEIKADSSIIAGPRHKLREIEIVRQMKGKDAKSRKIKEIAMKFGEKGAWHAHPEHVLHALLCSDDEEDRHYAIEKIVAIRNGENFGDSSPRPFSPPRLNWQARSIRDIQDWTGATEPLITTALSTNDLRKYLNEPFPDPKIPGHTQSCERCVKEVTAASARVFGERSRDGCIRGRIKSRELIPAIDTKRSLEAIIPS